MAKPKKDKVRSKALSAGSLTTHEAVSQFDQNQEFNAVIQDNVVPK
jgi:hypothetical protein